MRLQVRFLLLLSGLTIRRCRELWCRSVGRRHGSDPALLWLWRRLAATAPIQPLAWEPPYATGAAQEMAKRQKKKTKKQHKKNPPEVCRKVKQSLSPTLGPSEQAALSVPGQGF